MHQQIIVAIQGLIVTMAKIIGIASKLLGESYEEAHNAASVIKVTARSFWRMKELQII
jgi:hypothetical protein